MFTGLVSDVGEVRDVIRAADLTRFTIASGFDPATIALGASIACDGCCLTVVAVAPGARGADFAVEASPETLARTTLGHWGMGRRVNLERALKIGDELGGHIVSGHVDGVAGIVAITRDGGSSRFIFEAPQSLARFIAEKGSVTLNGTSLTVNHVDGARFGVTLIPHTLAVTTWGSAHPGDTVNIEIDLLARYAARLTEFTA